MTLMQYCSKVRMEKSSMDRQAMRSLLRAKFALMAQAKALSRLIAMIDAELNSAYGMHADADKQACADAEHEPKKLMSVFELDMSVRTTNALKRAGFSYAEQIEAALAKDPSALTHVRNLGRLSESEALYALEKHGFKANQEMRAEAAVRSSLKKSMKKQASKKQ